MHRLHGNNHISFDFDKLSKEFRFFYEAFSPESYGKSMGRAADYAAVDFAKLNHEEQQLAAEWFIELFEEKRNYYGIQYFDVIRQMQDSRFIPLIESYCKRLKKRNHKSVTAVINGKRYIFKTNFDSEIDVCRQTINSLS